MRGYARVIIVFLGLILALSLFGGHAVVAVMGLLFLLLVALGMEWAFRILARDLYKEIKEDLSRRRTFGGYYFAALGWIGLVGNFAVLGYAYFKDVRLSDIPLFWLPVSLFLLSLPLQWLEEMLFRHLRDRRFQKLHAAMQSAAGQTSTPPKQLPASDAD